MDIYTIYFNSIYDLGKLDNTDLVREYYNTGNLELREKLICGMIPLATSEAKKYNNLAWYRGISVLDVIQEANCGLISGIDNWDKTGEFVAEVLKVIHKSIKVFFYNEGNRGIKLKNSAEYDKFTKLQWQRGEDPYGVENFLTHHATLMNMRDSVLVDIANDEEHQFYDDVKTLLDIENLLPRLTSRESLGVKLKYGLCGFKVHANKDIFAKHKITVHDIEKTIRKLKIVASEGKLCLYCETRFNPKDGRQKFCNRKCQKNMQSQRQYKKLKLGNSLVNVVTVGD